MQKKVLRQSLPPKLHGRFVTIVHGNVQCHLLLLDGKKPNAALIFTAINITAKLGVVSGTLEIGLATILTAPHTHSQRFPVRAYKSTTAYNILSPNTHHITILMHAPMRSKNMPKWTVCSRHHSFGCSSQNTGS